MASTKTTKNIFIVYLVLLIIFVIGLCVLYWNNDCSDWRYYSLGSVGLTLIYGVFILLGHICLKSLCNCCTCCGLNQYSKESTKCKICCQGIFFNPFPIGLGYVIWGFTILTRMHNKNRCFGESLIKTLFLVYLIMLSLAIIIFSILYYVQLQSFHNAKYILNFQNKNGIMVRSPNNNDNIVGQNHNRKNSYQQNRDELFAKQREESYKDILSENNQDSYQPYSQPSAPPLVSMDNNNNIQNNSNLFNKVSPIQNESNVEDKPPPPAYDLDHMQKNSTPNILMSGNDNNNNNNNDENEVEISIEMQNIEDEENDGDNIGPLKDKFIRKRSPEDILNLEHRPSVSISLKEGIYPPNEMNSTNKPKTKGAPEVSISWPDEFLGYARRLSAGILNVIKITDPDLECVICCDNFDEGENMAQLNCGHMFHKECVLDWLQEKGECPYCRMDVKNYAKSGLPGKNSKKN